jgi:2-methylisocitrate lyase-like PEP mutase family enzyme
MTPISQRDRAETFRRLHRGPDLLVLPNAWDVVTARLVEEAGFPAVATTSAGIAWALGYPDGERITRAEMVDVVRRIAAAVRLPVTADMEAGYGATPEAAAVTAREVIAAGAIGLNLEDGTNEGGLVDVSLHVERIGAAREAGAAAGVPLVINARTDAFEVRDWAPARRFAEAVRRANAYHAAGADCLFVPHVSDAATIGRLAAELPGPLNVIAGPPAPPLGELARLGVRRASLGPRVTQAALGYVRRILAELRGGHSYGTMAEVLIPFAELQRLVAGAASP